MTEISCNATLIHRRLLSVVIIDIVHWNRKQSEYSLGAEGPKGWSHFMARDLCQMYIHINLCKSCANLR